MNKLSTLVAALAATVATPVLAQTYNPVVNGGPNNADFQYGYNAGAGFQAFDNYYGNLDCPRIANTNCSLRDPGNGGDFLGAYFVPTDTSTQGAFLFSTDVTLHPGPAGSDLAVVRFVAPTTSSYNFTGFYRGVDAPGSGNGVVVTSDNGNAVVFNDGNENGFNFALTLAAGSFVDFTVGNNNGYGNDTTGLSLLAAAVPEPATWALMIMGFGAVGGSMRARRRTTKVAFAA